MLNLLVRRVLLPMTRYVASMAETYTQPDRRLGHIKSLSGL